MAGTSAALELAKVKIAGKPLNLDDNDWASGDDTESEVSDADDNLPEPTAAGEKKQEVKEEEKAEEVDAIKWARYRDSRKDRSDGRVGWVC
jgi:hypothetical protein